MDKRVLKRIIDNRFFVLLMLLFLVAIASVPAFKSAVYDGHDLKFHLGRIQAIAESIQLGEFPIRYEANAWYGHGYISSLYYGNILLYMPALLVVAGAPVYRAYNIYIIFINTLTAFVGYYSFKGLLKDRYLGIIASYIYVIAGYRLANIYVRASLGEYTAMVFMPLCIYGLYRIYNSAEKDYSSIVALVFGATGLIQSHIISTELIAVLCLVLICSRYSEFKKVYRKLLVAVTFILVLNGFFLVPFISSYLSNDLYINHENGVDITKTGMVLRQVFGLITYNPLRDDGHSPAFNVGPMIIISELALVAGALKHIKKKEFFDDNNSDRVWFIQLAVIGVIATWLASNMFPWSLIGKVAALKAVFANIQFSSRFLGIQALCFAFAGAYYIGRLFDNSRKRFVVLIIVSTIALLEAGVFHYTLSFMPNSSPVTASEDWADWIYLPVGTEKQLLSSTDLVETTEEIILPVLAYNNVKIYTNSGEEIKTHVSDNNCLAVSKDSDLDGYIVKYEEPFIWKLSEVISLLGVVTFIIFIIRSKRKM